MRYTPTPNVGIADLHIHSRFSDGISSVKRILDHVERHTPLDVIAITDHNTIKGSYLAASLQDRYSFDVVVGEEILTEHGEIIGLFLTEEVKPKLPIDETIDLIHGQGGLAIAPHPFAIAVGGIGGIGIGLRNMKKYAVDAFEELNANPTTVYSNFLSRFLMRSLPVPRIGGSDAHTADSIGASATLFEGSNADDLKSSIRAHKTTPVKGSAWLKELMITLRVAPAMAAQALRLKNGTAIQAAAAAFSAEFPFVIPTFEELFPEYKASASSPA